MSFLTTLAVDDLESLLDGSLSLLVPHNLHAVHRADERILASFRVSELDGLRAGLVGDQAVDLASLIRVGLLVHGEAHELMRREVLVEPAQGVLRESLPVAVCTSDQVSACGRVSHLIGVPDRLQAGVSNVLGRAGDSNDVWHVLVASFEAVGSVLLPLPRLLVIENAKLDVVNRERASNNGDLAIKECSDLVTLLNIVLVRSDGDDLVSCDAVFFDPFLQVIRIFLRVSILEGDGIRVSGGSISFDHFYLNNDTQTFLYLICKSSDLVHSNRFQQNNLDTLINFDSFIITFL